MSYAKCQMTLVFTLRRFFLESWSGSQTELKLHSKHNIMKSCKLIWRWHIRLFVPFTIIKPQASAVGGDALVGKIL